MTMQELVRDGDFLFTLDGEVVSDDQGATIGVVG